MPDPLTASSGLDDDFDYSTPEAEEVIRAANSLVLDVTRPLAHRVALYERTLGLAVVPVLVRRAILGWWGRRQRQRRGGR